MLLLIIFATVSIGFSFLCSLLEASLLSLTPSFIAQQKENRPKLHRALNRLKDNIDQPLAAILTLNTIAHTAGAIGVGSQVTVVFGEAYLGWASALMTLLILIVSEIIPKTIGAKYWKQLAPMLPPTLNVLQVSLKPFIWLSELITRRIGDKEGDTDLRGEIKALASIGLDEGALDSDETKVITNILNLHEIRIVDAMTPRGVSQVVNPETTVAEFDQQVGDTPFSRYPVLNEKEEPLGYVHKADTYRADPNTPVGELMRPVESINVEDNVERIFMLMLRGRQHLCLVYDNLGTWQGLVTLEDIFETILGQDIVDETDNVANLRKYARQRWSKRLKKTVPPGSSGPGV